MFQAMGYEDEDSAPSSLLRTLNLSVGIEFEPLLNVGV